MGYDKKYQRLNFFYNIYYCYILNARFCYYCSVCALTVDSIYL